MSDLFSPAHLDAIVAQIPDLPSGVTHVVVGTVDESGVKVSARFARAALGPVTWELEAAGHYDWSGDAGGGLKTIFQW